VSSSIDFLERLGSDAHLRHAAATTVEQALALAQIDPAVQAAILSEDSLQLEALLGASTNVCCMVHHPEEEEEEGDEDDDDDDDDDDDEEDFDEEEDRLKSRRAVAVRVATAR